MRNIIKKNQLKRLWKVEITKQIQKKAWMDRSEEDSNGLHFWF